MMLHLILLVFFFSVSSDQYYGTPSHLSLNGYMNENYVTAEPNIFTGYSDDQVVY